MITHGCLNRYVEKNGLYQAACTLGAVMKKKHKVIEKWPYRLKKRLGQPGAQKEFDRLMRDSTSGKERYMEWKRVY